MKWISNGIAVVLTNLDPNQNAPKTPWGSTKQPTKEEEKKKKKQDEKQHKIQMW